MYENGETSRKKCGSTRRTELKTDPQTETAKRFLLLCLLRRHYVGPLRTYHARLALMCTQFNSPTRFIFRRLSFLFDICTNIHNVSLWSLQKARQCKLFEISRNNLRFRASRELQENRGKIIFKRSWICVCLCRLMPTGRAWKITGKFPGKELLTIEVN